MQAFQSVLGALAATYAQPLQALAPVRSRDTAFAAAATLAFLPQSSYILQNPQFVLQWQEDPARQVFRADAPPALTLDG
jgi:hypothetical protein